MSEHADALAYKADVPARTKDKVRDMKDSVVSAVTGGVDSMKSAVSSGTDSMESAVSDMTPSKDQMAAKARQAKGMAQDNPLGMAIGAIAVGFLAGLAVPATRIENERLGPMADEIKERAKSLGEEALERGKEVASEAAQAAKETAQERGREQAEELRDHAKDQAEEVRSSSSTSTGPSLL